MRVSDGRFHYPTGGSGLSANLDSNSVRDDRRAVVGFDAGWRFSPRLEARVLVADNETRTRSDNQPDSPGDTSGFYGTSRSSIYRRSADVRLNLFAARGHVVTLGGELSQQHESSRDTSRFQRFPQSVTTFTQTRRNTAAFAQWIGNVGERASFTASGRLDANERFGDFATYRAGAAYRFASGTRVRGAAGTAFKEPLFSETFNTSFSKGDSTLSPERTRSWEAGVEQSVASGRVLLSATWFDQRFRDLIQYKYSPATSPEPNYFNVGAAKSSGLELEARLPSLRTLSVGASYTYLTTAVTDSGFGNFGTFAKGDRLLRRPQQSANLALGWTPVQRTTFGATINRVGSRPDRDFGASKKVDLPAYTKVDLSADVSLPVPARAVALTLRVDNATNAAYQAVFGFPAPGRAVLVGARVGVGK
jgi:vitamin B12 transporter